MRALRHGLALAIIAWGAPLAAVTIDGSKYLCWSLPDALRDLRGYGLPLVFSNNVVRDEMQITTIPIAASPHQLLDQLIRPHGLKAQAGAGGRLLVIPDFSVGGEGATHHPWSTSSAALQFPQGFPSVLPDWIDQGTSSILTELRVPRRNVATPVELPATTRYLVLRLTEEPQAGWDQIAFDIKALIVEARAQSEALQVGLDASLEVAEKLLEHDLAPYLDAYVDRRATAIPAGDPAGRWWWRAANDGQTALRTLLRGAAQGADLVLLEGSDLDPLHRAFLALIRTLPSVDLDPQPAVSGIAPDRVRFLYDPQTGSYYLAVYAEPGRSQALLFSLAADLEARTLFPEGAAFSYLQHGRRSELAISGEHPFYLFELRREPQATANGSLRVDGRRLIDPYEEVVKNQVFREREARKIRSLDLMERRHGVTHSVSARQVTWIHRIFERRDQLTEYLHLGVLINGVPHPEGKLRIGHDFRAEASIELEPLEIELDKTYAYEFLGEERIDGHPTWKIGFRPLHSGAYLSGVVWIDQKTSAHRQLRAVHTGLRGPLISRETTRHYEWIADAGQCFWNWRRSTGLSVAEAFHTQEAWTVETERYDFRYNRPDVEQQIADAHASDVPIHVATPPQGHRWLIKRKEHDKRMRNRLSESLADVAASRFPRPGRDRLDPISDPDAMATSAQGPWDDRVLAAPGIYASTYEAYLRVQHHCRAEPCNLSGFSYHRQDLLANGAELYAGLYSGFAHASLAYPRLLGSDWMITGSASRRSTWEEIIPRSGDENDPSASGPTSIRWGDSSVMISIARSLNRHFRIHGSYSLGHLRFDRLPDTDPGFTVPSSTLRHSGGIDLDFRRPKLFVRTGFRLVTRSRWEPWGFELSEPIRPSFRRAWLTAGYSTRLGNDQSFGAQLQLRKGWDLDHFSCFSSAGSGLRVAGFQSRSYAEGLGAVVSYNRNLRRRVPVTLRLEAAALRSGDLPVDDVDQLGLAVESILNGPFKIDVFLRLGYGLYSSHDEEAGRVRSRLVLSRRF